MVSQGWAGRRDGRALACTRVSPTQGPPMTPLRLIYLALIIVGTILPWSYFYAWFT